ncbi:MAG: NAD(P)H-hydrate dehydratase [Acidobacteriota bacterium]
MGLSERTGLGVRVLSASAMAAVDRRAIDELGIPGAVLMENACAGLAEVVADVFPAAVRIVIVCGPGNNGGDGLGLVRHLDARGYRVEAFLVRGERRPAGDAGLQLDILERSGRRVTEWVTTNPDRTVLDRLIAATSTADLVVDALFGTGLSRPLADGFAEVVRHLDTITPPVLAVDLPSGLDGSRPNPIGPYLHATCTVTFAAPKIAHVLTTTEAVGELVVVDLAIPPELIEEAEGSWHLTTEAEATDLVTALAAPDEAHKGTFGHALVIGGSTGKAGAAVLAARGALRSGAGLVTAAVPNELVAPVDGASWESMTLGFAPSTDLDTLLLAASERDAVALGPGLGTDAETAAMVCDLVARIEAPLVLDADGLNAMVGALPVLTDRAASGHATVLTPHPGEAARLLGSTAAEVQADRPAAALALAERTGAVVVLKGHRSLIAEPDGTLWINPTGGPALGTGGTGDVLTGMLVGMLARRDRFDAAVVARLAVYVHGLAGELAATANGRHATLAGDLIDHLPAAWCRLGDERR